MTIPNELEWQLFDLGEDPGESRDQAMSDPERLARMRRQLEAFGEHLARTADALGAIGTDVEIDEKLLMQLEALGYGR